MKSLINHASYGVPYPQVMGILNLTPDSFSDGGFYTKQDAALRQAEKMIQEGAAWIDIGGESTRPGAALVSAEEELQRIIPVIDKIQYYFDISLSVDTSKPGVIREAAARGVRMINDIRALTFPGALEAASAANVCICLVHMQGQPQTMQQNISYKKDIISEVSDFFRDRIQDCQKAGIPRDRLLIDPGFGFGKESEHNYELLARLKEFALFDLPVLVGLSRKSMIGQLLHVPPRERMIGSVAGAVIAAMQGANIIRAHDVKETVQALRIVEAATRKIIKET